MSTQHTPGPWITAGPSFGDEFPRYTNSVVSDCEELAGEEYTDICRFDPGGWDAETEANALLISAAPELLAALDLLLSRDMANTCQHTETHRGGAIWEICDHCGMKWADDRGGKPQWRDPVEWDQARAAIAKATGSAA